MANQWLRLWHDMPNDPKWRTIARASKQPISTVIAVYVHMLVIASNANERGRTHDFCSEDVASALDIDASDVDAIVAAMSGRVIDEEGVLSGWSKRQVEREDGSAQRARAWREAKKQESKTQPNATERKRTPDKDTDKDIPHNPQGGDLFETFWKAYPNKKAKQAAAKAWSKLKLVENDPRVEAIRRGLVAAKRTNDWQKENGQYVPYAASWLNGKRWEDELSPVIVPLRSGGVAL